MDEMATDKQKSLLKKLGVSQEGKAYDELTKKEASKLIENGLALKEQPQQEEPVVETADKVDTDAVIAEKEARDYEPAPQEIGMWWKELGEMMRSERWNEIKKEQPDLAKSLQSMWWGQLFKVLGTPKKGG